MVCLATCKFKVANSETSNSSIIRAMEDPQRIFHNLNFKREIESTIRYKGIAEKLKSTLTPAYLAFVAFVSQDFESFLLTFQRKRANDSYSLHCDGFISKQNAFQVCSS